MTYICAQLLQSSCMPLSNIPASFIIPVPVREIVNFIKIHFSKTNNGLMQVLIVHTLVFVGRLLCKAACVLLGYSVLYHIVYARLVLPTTWAAFVHQPWSLLTYFWLHEGFFITLRNLVILYGLGQIVTSRSSGKHFVWLYFLGNVIGGGLLLCCCSYNVLFSLASPYVVDNMGGLYAAVVSAAILAPDYAIYLLFIQAIPLRYFVGLLLLYTLYELSGADPAAGVVQLGGAFVGYLYTSYIMQRSFGRWFNNIRNPFARQEPVLKVVRRAASQETTGVEEVAYVDQSAIDAILDKIAATGYESLTQAEKQRLFEAGR